MSISRRALIGRGLSALGGLALAGTVKPMATLAAEIETARLQMAWINNVENLGEFTAFDRGYYEEEGLFVFLDAGGPNVDVVEAVTSGKALVGLMPADLAARARADGQPVKIVGTTFQRNPLAVMSLATDSIETPMELVGKRLGVPDADRPIAEAFFRVLGIDPGSVNLTRVQFNPTPLVENKVDAFLSFVTNQPIQLAVQGIDTVTFLLADYGFNTFTDTFVVTEQTLADPAAREKVVKILRATSRGWRTAIDDTEAATERVVDWYGREYQLDLESQLLTARSQIALIETGDTRANGLLTMSDAAIAVNIETLGHAGVAIAADALFDPSLLAEVYQKGINLG